MSLAPSTRLGPYELGSLLGSGGMGEVYRARDARLGREVAIKVLPAEYSADPDRLRRFEQEARAAAALNHPNILAVFDVGTETDTPYVVSELLEGQTLRDALGAGRLPIRKALDYATQVAMGLAAAHEKGIIHRDIKPENIFVTTDGRIKLLDFGLAKLRQDIHQPAALRATQQISTAGMMIGTAGYVSPEQLRAEPVDHRTDIFSFGATFYEMVSGARAFKGSTAIETLHAILNQDPPDLAIPVAPPELARVIHHCLEKDPGHRFQSARDLAFALGQLTGMSSSGVIVPHVPTSSEGRRLMPMAGAIVTVLVLTGAAYLFTRGETGGGEAVASQPSFQQVTFRRGHICCPRFTPDGQTVLSNASWDGSPWAIMSTRLDTLASTALGLDGAGLLSISRSGELALLVKGDTLARVPLGQNGIRELKEGVRDADWAPDGTLAAIRVEAGRNWLEYPLGQTIFEDTATMWTARVSPDGELVAIIQQQGKEWLTIVDRRGNVRSRSEKRPAVFQEGLAWTPDGREVWFSAADVMFKSAIHAMTPDGRERLVHRSVGSVRINDIAPDGRALVVHDINHSDMRVVDTETHAERNLAWSGVAFRPLDLSDDGRHLTFQAMDADGRPWAYIRQTDGSPAVQLGDGFPIAISPDAKWVLVSAPGAPLRLLPVGAGEMRTLSRGRLENIRGPANWTPDGQRIVFVGNEAGKPPRMFVQHVSGGDPAPVTPEGARIVPPIVSPDSSAILGADAERRLVKYRLDGRAPPAALDGALPGDVPLAWSPDDTSVWVLVRRETPAKIFRIDLRTGRRTLWYEVPLSDPASSPLDTLLLQMAADGRTFVYAYDKHLSDLYVAYGLK